MTILIYNDSTPSQTFSLLYNLLHLHICLVSVIDEGLLNFSKLEELILSANLISEVSPENLPRTLKAAVLYQRDSAAFYSLSDKLLVQSFLPIRKD